MAHGNSLGSYELIEKVGQGAMGAVFKARQVSMDRVVALKVLPRKLAEDEAFVRRFEREARSAGKLSHQNLLQVYDVGEADGYHYFSMEFAGGPSLKEVLERDGPLGEKTALDYMTKIASALGEAHRGGIVHRDVKPANILLTDRGEPKLADLGLAKPMTGAGDLTTGDTALGTPHYMAPEQARGEDVDGRADLYSLGATVFQLLTGSTLFTGRTTAAVMAKHLADRPPKLREVKTDASAELESVIDRLLAKKPEGRYPDAEALVEDLEAVAAGRRPRHVRIALAARHGTAGRRPRHAEQRGAGRSAHRRGGEGLERGREAPAASGKGAVIAAAVIGVGVLAVGGYFLLGGGKQPDRPSRAAREKVAAPHEKREARAPAPAPSAPGAPARPGASKQAGEMLAFAESYWEDNPDDYEKSLSYLRRAGEAGKGSVVELEAEEAIGRVEKAWQAKAEEALSKAKEGAATKLGGGDYDGALAELRAIPASLQGKIGDETRRLRTEIESAARARQVELLAGAQQDLDGSGRDLAGVRAALAELKSLRFEPGRAEREKAAAEIESDVARLKATLAAQAASAAEEKLDGLLDEFERSLQAGSHDAAHAKMSGLAAEDENAAIREVLSAAADVAKSLAEKQKAIRQAAEAEIGNQLRLATTRGVRSGTVKAVTDDGVLMVIPMLINRKKVGEREELVAWNQLTPQQELLLTMGWSLKGPAAAIIRAYLAVWAGKADDAEKALASAAQHPLEPRLRGHVEGIRMGKAEFAAKEAWAAIQKKYGSRTLTPASGRQAEAALASFEQGHGRTAFTQGIARAFAELKKRARRAQIVNFVVNGGFENGLEAWRIETGAAGQGVVVVSEGAAEGGKCLSLRREGRDGQVGQTLALQPGRGYRLSFMVRWEEDIDNDVRVSLDAAGGIRWHRDRGDGPVDWRRVELVFVAERADHTLRLMSQTRHGVLFDDLRVERMEPGIPADAKRHKGHAYKAFTFQVNWRAAKSWCEALGGHLVTVTSREENDFVERLIEDDSWGGFTDEAEEGTWRWITGEEATFVNWKGEEPDNGRGDRDEHFLRFEGDGDWSDRPWSAPYYFVCEWEPPARGGR